MDYVMVTFQADPGIRKELKVPTFVTIQELLGMLTEALHMPLQRDHLLQAEPLGRILDSSLTLQDEGVAHGALLTLI